MSGERLFQLQQAGAVQVVDRQIQPHRAVGGVVDFQFSKPNLARALMNSFSSLLTIWYFKFTKSACEGLISPAGLMNSPMRMRVSSEISSLELDLIRDVFFRFQLDPSDRQLFIAHARAGRPGRVSD